MFIIRSESNGREYLEEELRPKNVMNWNFERAIDDFIFICFFVGNDFLPHIPSLTIREGAIDFLTKLYVKEIGEKGVYITGNGSSLKTGRINFDYVRFLLQSIGEIEMAVFVNRTKSREMAKKRRLRDENNEKGDNKDDYKDIAKESTNLQQRAEELLQTMTRRQFRLEKEKQSEKTLTAREKKAGWIRHLFYKALKTKLSRYNLNKHKMGGEIKKDLNAAEGSK